MRVYLKGGCEFTVEVTEYKTERDPFSGNLTRLKWTARDKAKSRLTYVNLNEVAAIVREG